MDAPTSTHGAPTVAVIGGGPAGLAAAEVLVSGGVRVEVFDAMPSLGRKFLMAGKGGLNLTHSEPFEAFVARYGARRFELEPLVGRFDADALCAWAHRLGVDTFVGSSGRIFPTGKKAAPLLRAWLHRLRAAGVRFHVRHRWIGWEGVPALDAEIALRFQTPTGEQVTRAHAAVLACGGASWPQLGSEGAWVPILTQSGVPVAPLRPANCGFDVGWTEFFRSRFAGQPVKSVVLTYSDGEGVCHRRQGEFVITQTGIEGGLVYACAAALRDTIAATGEAWLTLDLLPSRSLDRVLEDLQRPRGSRSLGSWLQTRMGLPAVKAALLRECLPPEAFSDKQRLAAGIKALALRLVAPRPLAEAISTAGGVSFAALDERLMLRDIPGVFCAGEMLDWEAPTGGYLLTACFATGRAAGEGALAWLRGRRAASGASQLLEP